MLRLIPRTFTGTSIVRKKDAQGIPPLKKRNGGGVAQSESEKAAEFNGQFTDVFTKSEYSQVPLLDRSAPFMEDIVVTKEGVTKLLKGLNPSKALGPDELHPRVLKELATELGPIFTHLFQQSIDSGDIPKEWTLANISPLFKKGDRSLACNYRPVSLTCVPSKLLEHIASWPTLMNIRREFYFILVLGSAGQIFSKMEIKIKVPLINFIFILSAGRMYLLPHTLHANYRYLINGGVM